MYSIYKVYSTYSKLVLLGFHASWSFHPYRLRVILGTIRATASSCTSGTLSSMPWEGCAGVWWVPWNPENKRYMLYQLYIQVYVCYIHGIYMIYTAVRWKHIVAADLYFVCVYIHGIFIYVILLLYTWYIHGIFQFYAIHTNMVGIYLAKFSWVCSVPVTICQVYWWRRHSTGIYRVHTMYIACICRSGCDIPLKYQEYTWYIPHGIYHVYTYYIDMIHNTWTEYIHSICLAYT